MAISDGGRGLALADATELEVYMPAEATYVRFECWGAGGRQAWTQPFFAAGVCAAPRSCLPARTGHATAAKTRTLN